jgi:membrane associated rhomboid family serine protease
MLPLGTIGRSNFRPYVTFTLIVMNFLVFVLELAVFAGGGMEQFLNNYALSLCRVATDPFAVTVRNATFTMFLHADPAHLLFNMVFLWVFAPRVEEFFGHWRFLAVYLIVGWFSSLAQVLLGGIDCGPAMNGVLIGASGALSGVMGAFFWLHPGARVRTLVLYRIIPIHAFIYVLGWVGNDIYQVLTNPMSRVAHWAHIGGFISGIVLLFIVTMFIPAPQGDPLEHLNS